MGSHIAPASHTGPSASATATANAQSRAGNRAAWGASTSSKAEHPSSANRPRYPAPTKSQAAASPRTRHIPATVSCCRREAVPPVGVDAAVPRWRCIHNITTMPSGTASSRMREKVVSTA